VKLRSIFFGYGMGPRAHAEKCWPLWATQSYFIDERNSYRQTVQCANFCIYIIEERCQ
jgi:hypothetical protein